MDWGQDAKKMVNRANFEANFHEQPEVAQFFDEKTKQYKLPIKAGDKEYKKFCLHALEMLYRLDKKTLLFSE